MSKKKKKKEKNQKDKRKKALKALFDSKYFMNKIAILMRMEDYSKDEVKKAFKKAMKNQAEKTEISLTAWSDSKPKKKNKDDIWTIQTDTAIDSNDKSKVVKRQKNRETADLISQILG